MSSLISINKTSNLKASWPVFLSVKSYPQYVDLKDLFHVRAGLFCWDFTICIYSLYGSIIFFAEKKFTNVILISCLEEAFLLFYAFCISLNFGIIPWSFCANLEGVSLFLFLFTQSTISISVERDPEKNVIQLGVGWDKVQLLLQHEIECNIKRKIIYTQILRRNFLNGMSKYLDSNSQKKNAFDPNHFCSVWKDLMGNLVNESQKINNNNL